MQVPLVVQELLKDKSKIVKVKLKYWVTGFGCLLGLLLYIYHHKVVHNNCSDVLSFPIIRTFK